MIGLLGKKVGMTQIFDKDGNRIPVTVLEVGPCAILQVKKTDTDGYQAVQLGFDSKKESKATKAELGHAKKSNSAPKRFIREIRTEQLEGLEAGKELQINNFSAGDKCRGRYSWGQNAPDAFKTPPFYFCDHDSIRYPRLRKGFHGKYQHHSSNDRRKKL